MSRLRFNLTDLDGGFTARHSWHLNVHKKSNPRRYRFGLVGGDVFNGVKPTIDRHHINAQLSQ